MAKIIFKNSLNKLMKLEGAAKGCCENGFVSINKISNNIDNIMKKINPFNKIRKYKSKKKPNIAIKKYSKCVPV